MNKSSNESSLLLDFQDKQFLVSIISSKEHTPGLILIDLQTKKAKSNRTPTELINKLLAQGATTDTIKTVSTFINTTMKKLQEQN